MKTMNMMRRFTGVTIALTLLLSATGCGSSAAETPAQDTVLGSVQEPAPVDTQIPDAADAAMPDVDSVEVTKYESVSERIRSLKDSADSEAKTDSAEVTDMASDMANVESVARIKSLIGKTNYGETEIGYCSSQYVDVTDGHNPYDLVWTYGDRKTEGDDGFGSLYASYVAACDWSLVFDVEYYKAAFPLLAKQYHDNGELLLEHFQTVGVHEGRQGCTDFNVSAYMDHCGKALTEAFGDNSVCYYFYYMLNHNTEKSVDTSNSNNKYPLWRTLELTDDQQNELEWVNKYREEVGSDPVKLDPELIALANYRSWANAEYGYVGHDWLYDHENECQQMLDLLGVNSWSENTVAYYKNVGEGMLLGIYAIDYRHSEGHYNAMVNQKFSYLGVSHMYRNLETKSYLGAFDVFTKDAPKTSTAR